MSETNDQTHSFGNYKEMVGEKADPRYFPLLKAMDALHAALTVFTDMERIDYHKSSDKMSQDEILIGMLEWLYHRFEERVILALINIEHVAENWQEIVAETSDGVEMIAFLLHNIETSLKVHKTLEMFSKLKLWSFEN